MEQRTCNIAMCCKHRCGIPGTEGKSALELVAAYMSKECACPVEDYKGHLLESIMREALFDYMNGADRPGSDLRRLFDRPALGPEPSMSERIASVFSLAQVREQKKDGRPGEMEYVNGFTEALVKQSRIDLEEPECPEDGSAEKGGRAGA